MSRSILDANNDAIKNHKTKDNTFEMFPIGSRVKVICVCQDYYFFNHEKENTNGTVIRNSGKYLGIIVKWDEPRQYECHFQEEFNFEPSDLVLLDEKPEPIKIEPLRKFAMPTEIVEKINEIIAKINEGAK